MPAKQHRTSKRPLHKKNMTREQAKRYALKHPENADAWQWLGRLSAKDGDLDEARKAFEKAAELAPSEPKHYEWLGYVAYKRHNVYQALAYLDEAESVGEPSAHGLITRAKVYLDHAAFGKSLALAERARQIAPNDIDVLSALGAIYLGLYRYDDAKNVYERLIKLQPGHYSHWNGAGNVCRELGRIDDAYFYYFEAVKRAAENPLPYSNQLTAMHYDPMASREAIAEMAQAWEARYAPKTAPPRPRRTLQPSKRLRIGFFSDGLRKHPVGKMIIRCLGNLATSEAELFAYTSSEVNDELTRRIKAVVHHWQSMQHLSDEDFAQIIREDEIDILIDLTGHNAGNRMRVMAMQPAPLLVKWVGGLINTTGVQAIDYLISDAIETPPGEDAYYTEKLIRMPDDYIVFDPPAKLPPLAELPANRNGYITLACFNNPTKLNSVTLARWARIMQDLPNSKLLLKGRPYTSEAFCERLYSAMEAEGIKRERLIIEGPGSNYELLEAYNQADIALDPWPYSGGLTTCEAFLMGVPVVTLPGPTFAGRHSATHLTHAGMPELVTHSWEEYHTRVLELASDLESLSTIRRSLRQVLLQSPLCDGPRFAKHFTQAMRAIWQRYCEKKAPEALSFNAAGDLWFEDDKQLLDIQAAEKSTSSDSFQWELIGKLVVLDNSAKLIKASAAEKLAKTNAFALLAFDAASDVQNPEAYAGHEHIQLFQQTSLGDGQPAKLNACLEPALSSSLTPLPDNQLPERHRKGAKVLAQLPINTIALDSINGLASLDWLILDELSDAASILEHGKNALKDTLLIQACVSFQPTHERQPSLAELQHWASRNGFRFYRFNNEQHVGYFPESVPEEKRQATELQSADALFLPSHDRQAQLSDNQRTKLAFLLHTVYGIKDMAYKLLKDFNEDKAEKYLAEQSLLVFNSEKTGETPQSEKEEPYETTNSTQEFPLPDAPHMSLGERKLFKISLEKANQYFEFGSGGSTVWAIAEGLTVKGVESDDKWVNALKNKLGEKCQIEAVDVGPTKEWGFPVSMQEASKFPAYSTAIHQHPQAFDLILVDGRFRVACTMAAIQHILEYSKEPEKARIFIHDFWNRPHYHVVLKFLETVEKAESAALFKIAKNVERNKVADLWEEYAKQPQ
ncbi:O-linked N-acetylglucosamine transferase, SPINDLY family protein [Halomonas sp. CSM-2]|uniref:O-linked N-acetylglucosamine transferase, SPINDLY family protein n=1 Tax=Halomonas sp. CSM-2 TaxID=1975722 RepID=UPI000A289E53|nr:tetratricopeptide repeat protein [Halomonas sp. CSM-2]